MAVEREERGEADVARNNLRDTILEIFGPNSPEYRAHPYMSFRAGPMYTDMPHQESLQARIKGGAQAVRIVEGLIDRLRERREEVEGGGQPTPSSSTILASASGSGMQPGNGSVGCFA
jgi:hypothetical protein